MSLEAFGVKNLRCLTDTGFVPIKPITLLVGRNSSGKSTFLRAFPLLRQSVETARESPILWYDPKYVDFGSLEDAAGYPSEDASVTFRFRVRLDAATHWVTGQPAFDISMKLARGDHGAYLASYEILVEDHTITLRFAPDRKLLEYTVDSFDLLPEGASLTSGGRVILLPTLQEGDPSRSAFIPVSRAPNIELDQDYEYEGALATDFFWILAEEATQGVPPEAEHPWRADDPVPLGSYSAMLAGLPDVDRDAPGLRRAIALWVAAALPVVLDHLDREVAHWFERVTYLAPLRVSASRTYRVQELSVEEIDPQGQNLSMFLQALSAEEADELGAFTSAYLDFECRVRRDRLNVEILVKERGSKRFVNLVDVGFGYAEILPFAVTLWATCVRPARTGARQTSMLVIEQPELHLHPAHQAKLGRMIAGAMLESRKAGREVKLMIETHSEALVNGLGDLIAAKQLDASDVQIVLFDQDGETRQTAVRAAHYDEEGALLDWPYGFFAPVPDAFLASSLPLAGEE